MAKKKQKKQQAGQQFLSPEQFMRQRARLLEIGPCYVSDDMTSFGEGYVAVTRKHTGGRTSIAVYLIDTFCLGVKKSFYRLRLEDYELKEMLDDAPDMRECSYEEAHNWVYGAISWAEEAGIEPDKSFNITQYMLEEDTDGIPLIEYEFGHQGKHLLMANSVSEANRYLPLLEKHLGEGNYDYTIGMDDDEDMDWDDTDISERLKNLEESPLFKSYGPSTKYTYRHPAYPQSMQLEGPEWFYKELDDTANQLYLPDELTDRILALPREIVCHDLEQIILYHMGQTCDGIPEGYDSNGFTGIVANSIILLGEVGNVDSSLDLVLETMRQSDDFMDYHFGDAGDDILVPTLYLLGQNRLDKLMNYVQEEGLETFFKCRIFSAVAQIAIAQPERRGEVVDWFRQVLHFAIKMLPQTQWFDNVLAGLILHDLIDIQAKELLPEIRGLFATGLVDLGACGDFDEVARLISNPFTTRIPDACITDVHERFADMKRRWEH